MNKYIINDEFLYKHVKSVENIIIRNLPREEELNHIFSKRFQKKMNKTIKQERRSLFMKSFVNYGKKIAVVFLIFISIVFATTMSVEAYRVKFFEIVTEVWEEFTSIIFESKESINDAKLIPTVSEYIPSDFYIIEENINDYMYSVIYTNSINEEIFYEQRLISDGEVLLDTENIEIEIMQIGNQEVVLFTNKGVNQIYWSDNVHTYTIISSIKRKEIIEMAKSILK